MLIKTYLDSLTPDGLLEIDGYDLVCETVLIISKEMEFTVRSCSVLD